MPSTLEKEEAPLHDLHRSIVTIYVGPEEYPFYFHKGRLCQQSSFFEKAFQGSFHEATSGSMYLKEDGVDEVRMFEEWVYSDRLNFPRDSDDPSLLMVKVFCFAEKVGISDIQNATLDAIRDRAAKQPVSWTTPKTAPALPPGFFESTSRTSPSLKRYPTTTADAITYAYEHTPEGSPLRKLLADIFAYDVKSEELEKDILSFPPQFMADVLLITMKRLPFRSNMEKAQFYKDAKRYHVEGSSSPSHNRIRRMSEDKNAIDDEDDTLYFDEISSLKGKPIKGESL